MKSKIPLQVYGSVNLFVEVVKSADQVKVRMGKDDDSVTVNGFCHWDKTNFHILIHKKTSPGEIAHEVVHFLNALYKLMGQVYDLENDEIFCYKLAYFTDLIIKLQKKG